MAVPREVLRLPKLRGLHDFPEQAAQGSACQALNVEFSRGGPGIRPGTVKIKDFAQDAATIMGRGVWLWETVATEDSPSGRQLIVVGFIKLAGGAGYIGVYETSGDHVATFALSEHRDNNGAGYRAFTTNWDATVFTPSGLAIDAGFNALIVATDKPFVPAGPTDINGNEHKDWQAGLWALYESSLPGNQAGLDIKPITPVKRDREFVSGGNRVDLSYWGNTGGAFGVPNAPEADDAGPYLGTEDIALNLDLAAEIVAADIEDRVHIPAFDDADRANQVEIGARIVTVYRNRLVIASMWGDPSGAALRFANLGDLQKHPAPSVGQDGRDTSPNAFQGWPANNIVYFNQPDPTPITGLAVWRDFLLVFKRRSISMCRFTGIEDFEVIQSFQGVGCVAPDSIQTIHRSGADGVMFLADDGVYLFDGKPRYVSGPIQRTLRSALAYNAHLAISTHFPRQSQYWIGIPGGTGSESEAPASGASGDTSTFYILDYDTGNWSTYTYGSLIDALVPVAGVVGRDELTPVSLSRAATTTLRLAHHKGPAGTDGIVSSATHYKARWELQRFPYGRHQVRRWSFLRIDLDDAGGVQPLTVYWKTENQSRAAADANSQSTTTPAGGFEGAPLFGGALTFGNLKFDEPGFVSARIAMNARPARWFRWGVETSGTVNVADWHVTSAEVDTRRKEGRR